MSKEFKYYYLLSIKKAEDLLKALAPEQLLDIQS